MNFADSGIADPREPGLVCPQCDGTDIDTSIERDSFEFKNSGESHSISALVPFRVCRSCGFAYTDHEAETARHEAVCRYFGLLTPTEILRIREGYGLTREQFATITKIGTATLGRWERGVVLQNPANDQYLRLLADPRVFAKLQPAPVQPLRPVVAGSAPRTANPFRCVESQDVNLQRAARGFRLCVPA
ncbi:MAG: hypothetical protein AMXMBFR55_23900 [Gemmatimonadota bacterium]